MVARKQWLENVFTRKAENEKHKAQRGKSRADFRFTPIAFCPLEVQTNFRVRRE